MIQKDNSLVQADIEFILKSTTLSVLPGSVNVFFVGTQTWGIDAVVSSKRSPRKKKTIIPVQNTNGKNNTNLVSTKKTLDLAEMDLDDLI